jgi:hypothetical protein
MLVAVAVQDIVVLQVPLVRAVQVVVVQAMQPLELGLLELQIQVAVVVAVVFLLWAVMEVLA